MQREQTFQCDKITEEQRETEMQSTDEEGTHILSVFACKLTIHEHVTLNARTFSSESPGWQVTTLSPGHLGNVSLQFLSH